MTLLHGSRTIICLALIAGSAAACATVEIPSPTTVLSENQVIDLIRHPARWHRRNVTLRIYPYDIGPMRSDAGWSYVICFDSCDLAVAERSVFLIHARTNRFDGYAGDRAVIVSARFDACNVEWRCADLWTGAFTELERRTD